MSGMDRFAEFLRREARGYNEAPGAPVEVMWRGVEVGLEETDRTSGGEVEGVVGGAWAAESDRGDDEPVDALGYHEAPRAPREEMWGRIEGLTAGRRGPWRWPAWQWSQRRQVAGWAAGLAAAASLVLGLALGRNVGPSQPGEVVGGPQPPAPVTGPGVEPAGASVPTASIESPTSPANLAQTAEPVRSTDVQPEVLAAGVLPLPAAAADPEAAAPGSEVEISGVPVAGGAPVDRTALFARPFSVRRDDETIRYLGRAETLLTAFRIDQRTPVSERDLAMWARDLLIETRMRLDLPVSRTPEENALLEDLELILLQISRLGTGVRHVEWQLARESMELKGTLPRLRAVSSTDGL